MEQEQLRHQYLDAMGITSWLSRSALPGAAPSPDWVNDFQYPAPEIPFESEPRTTASQNLPQSGEAFAAAPASAPAPVVDRSQSIAALNQAIDGISAPVPSSTPQTVSPVEEMDAGVEEQVATEPAEQPNFKLAFQRIGDLLVVDSLPPQGGNFTSNYQNLAAAIAASLGVVGDLSEPFMLPWPMFASKTLDQSRKQAVIAVQHKLNKEQQKAPLRAVLLFGESAAQMILDRQEPIEQLSRVLLTLSGGAKAVASLSLTEAMQLPGVKKQIWQDLQPLLNYLQKQADA